MLKSSLTLPSISEHQGHFKMINGLKIISFSEKPKQSKVKERKLSKQVTTMQKNTQVLRTRVLQFV